MALNKRKKRLKKGDLIKIKGFLKPMRVVKRRGADITFRLRTDPGVFATGKIKERFTKKVK